MTVIQAHFDGRVFVPDEPVNVPANTPLRLVVIEGGGDKPLDALAALAKTFDDVPGWPADGASEHDHYLYGTPKKRP